MYNKHLGSQVLRTREIERSDQVLEASRVSILTVGTTKRKAENLGDVTGRIGTGRAVRNREYQLDETRL
jgi:hypothetical protein